LGALLPNKEKPRLLLSPGFAASLASFDLAAEDAGWAAILASSHWSLDPPRKASTARRTTGDSLSASEQPRDPDAKETNTERYRVSSLALAARKATCVSAAPRALAAIAELSPSYGSAGRIAPGMWWLRMAWREVKSQKRRQISELFSSSTDVPAPTLIRYSTNVV